MPATVVALTADFKSDKVCFGSATTLVSLSTPRDSIRLLLWDINGDGKFGDEKGDTVSVIFSSAGEHNVGLKVVTYAGESKAIYQLVSVVGMTVDFSVENGCSTQPTTFTERLTVLGDNVIDYMWNFGDGSLQSHDRNALHTYTGSGQYLVKLTATTSAGCKDSLLRSLVIGPPPLANLVFKGDTLLRSGDSIIVSIQGEIDSALWSTGQKSREIVIKSEGLYWVNAYAGGCFIQKSFRVRIRQGGTVPVVSTLFTPNGDGINDRWEILNLEGVGPCEVSIFSRSGEKIFSNPDYRNDWDGSYHGFILANDTYYYFVRCFDNIQYQGTLNILK